MITRISSSSQETVMLLFMASHIFMEDALPYLQVGRQDQEDRWDRHYPKQLENNIFCIKIWRCYLIYFDQYHYQRVCTETQMLSKWKRSTMAACCCTLHFGMIYWHHTILWCEISPIHFSLFFPPYKSNPKPLEVSESLSIDNKSHLLL